MGKKAGTKQKPFKAVNGTQGKCATEEYSRWVTDMTRRNIPGLGGATGHFQRVAIVCQSGDWRRNVHVSNAPSLWEQGYAAIQADGRTSCCNSAPLWSGVCHDHCQEPGKSSFPAALVRYLTRVYYRDLLSIVLCATTLGWAWATCTLWWVCGVGRPDCPVLMQRAGEQDAEHSELVPGNWIWTASPRINSPGGGTCPSRWTLQ